MSKELFHFMSKRLNSENNISDVTWAFIQTFPKFKEFFIKFFFENVSDELSETIIDREYSIPPYGRPDFYFEVNGEPYIVEVKKYDTDYHHSYKHITANVAIIAIDTIDKSLTKFNCFTWKEFYLKIKNSAVLRSIKEIEYYLIYLKNTCKIIEKETMKLQTLNHIRIFSEIQKEVIDEIKLPCITNIQKITHKCVFDRYGLDFEVTFTNSKTLKLFFGLFFEDKVTVTIAIDGNKTNCKKIHEKLSSSYIEYKELRRKNDFLAIYLDEKKNLNFLNLNTWEEQKIALNEFIEDMLKSISKII